MAREIGDLLGALGITFFGLAYLSFFVLVLWLPVMAFSATRNIKKIRLQLERLNDTLESKVSVTKTGPLGL